MNKITTIIFFTLVSFTLAQEKEYLGIDEKTGKEILIGIADRSIFSDSNFVWWFDSGYRFYDVDTLSIEELNSIEFDSIFIKIVLGTWCSDSRREVPRFFKIADELKIPDKSISMFGVKRGWKDDNTEIDSLNVKLVPTFIFYKKNMEIGRIVETPLESFEKDMLNILK